MPCLPRALELSDFEREHTVCQFESVSNSIETQNTSFRHELCTVQ